jgi:hypothetical protein
VSTEVVLLLLRVISGGLLLALLLVILAALWRDYRGMAADLEASQRSYGQLVEMTEIDGDYIFTGQVYPLLPLTSLGRAPTNTVMVNDTFASSEHALVAMRDGQWWLEDRQSRNGTTINEIPINQAVVIADGDIIGIGTVRYRVNLA